MSTGSGWEGLRQVCATLLGGRHVPERLWCGLSSLSGVCSLLCRVAGNTVLSHMASDAPSVALRWLVPES